MQIKQQLEQHVKTPITNQALKQIIRSMQATGSYPQTDCDEDDQTEVFYNFLANSRILCPHGSSQCKIEGCQTFPDDEDQDCQEDDEDDEEYEDEEEDYYNDNDNEDLQYDEDPSSQCQGNPGSEPQDDEEEDEDEYDEGDY